MTWERFGEAAQLAGPDGIPRARARKRLDGEGYEWAVDAPFGTIASLTPLPTLEHAMLCAEAVASGLK